MTTQMLTDALIRGRQATRGLNGCLYTRLLSKTEELYKFYLTKNACVKAQVNLK